VSARINQNAVSQRGLQLCFVKLKLIRPIVGIHDEPGTNWILTKILPFFRQRFVGSKQMVETTLLPKPRHSSAV